MQRETRRYKICVWCLVSFKDTSERLTQKTCSKQCARELAVTKRKENGSYKRTDKQNKKLSQTLKQQYQSGKRLITISSAIIEVCNSKRRSQINYKRKETCKKRYGVEHWMKTVQGREFTSNLHKNKIVSIATRKKLSSHAQKQTHRFSRCRGGFREDLQHYFRSSWEANYARILNYQGISWEYETQNFDLGDGLTYTPDFKIGTSQYIEIKGWLTNQSKEKIRRFKLLYPNVKLEIVQRKRYRELYQQYKNLIPNWEKVTT